jgi:transposase InsO family protein
MNALVTKLFYKDAIRAPIRLFKMVKTRFPKTKRKHIDEWLSNQVTTQVHKRHVRVKRKQYKPIISAFKNEKWFADVLYIKKVAGHNNMVKYLLTVVDVYSRQGYAIPMVNRDAESAKNAFLQMMEDMRVITVVNGRKKVTKVSNQPAVLQTDNGTEFVNSVVKAMLDEKGIIHDTVKVKDHKSQSIIERFNQTIKQNIEIFMTMNDTKKIIEALPTIVKQYNNTPHTLTGIKPNEVLESDPRIDSLNTRRIQGVAEPTHTFKVGDRIRIKLDKEDLSAKGADPNWTDEVFTIILKNIDSYRLEDKDKVPLKDSYMWYELLKIEETETNPFIHRPSTRALRSHTKELQEDNDQRITRSGLATGRDRKDERQKIKAKNIVPKSLRGLDDANIIPHKRSGHNV